MITLTTIVALYGYLAPPAIMLWAGVLCLRSAWRDTRRTHRKRPSRAATT